jgi:hypothetical protein
LILDQIVIERQLLASVRNYRDVGQLVGELLTTRGRDPVCRELGDELPNVFRLLASARRTQLEVEDCCNNNQTDKADLRQLLFPGSGHLTNSESVVVEKAGP